MLEGVWGVRGLVHPGTSTGKGLDGYKFPPCGDAGDGGRAGVTRKARNEVLLDGVPFLLYRT